MEVFSKFQFGADENLNQKTYTTKEMADSIGIHVNTLRFYDEIGFITKPKRRGNGYRIYTDLHMDQCRLIRKAMHAEVLQNGLRKKAVEIVKLCAELNLDKSLEAADEYVCMIDREIANAKAAIAAVEKRMKNAFATENIVLKRREAANLLNITSETLRTWERCGLLKVHRRENGYRVYHVADMERLNMIRTLRCANYSLSAILRLLNGLDRNEVSSIETVLNSPGWDEDILSVCDQLIVSLCKTRVDAGEMVNMILQMKEKYQTIH